MNALRLFLLNPFMECLGWGLLHFLWEGVVIAALLAIALRVLRNRSPNARYLAGWVALVAMACAVPLTAWLATASPAPAPIAFEETMAVNEPPADALIGTATIDITKNWPRQETVVPPTLDRTAQPALEYRPVATSRLAARVSLALRPALPWLVGGWLAGALLLSMWHLGGLWQLGRLRRVGTREVPDTVQQTLENLLRRFAIRAPVKLLISVRVAVPTLIGWLRPVILMPASILTELPPQQLELILAHELAHLRRCDYLLNLLQTAIETLLFYHPAVWWVSRQIRVERESCCDDQAASVGDRLLYARALASLAELCQPTRLVSPDLALGADGGSLSARIRRLLGLPAGTFFPTARSAGAVLAVVAILTMTVGFHLSAPQGNAEQPGASPSAEKSNDSPPSATVDEGRRSDRERLLSAELATPGHVADTQGHGIANVTVNRTDSPWSATTDAQGKFSLPELKLGETVGLTVSAAGLLPVKEHLSLIRNDSGYYLDTGEWPIELFRAVTLSGRVLGPDGKPLAGAPLSLDTWTHSKNISCAVGNYRKAITDEQGRFTMERIPPGSHVLYYPGQAPRSIPAKGVYGALVLEPKEGQQLSGLVLDLSQCTASVEGRVIGPDRKPMAGVTVNMGRFREWKLTSVGGMSGGGGPHASSPKTGADGRYKLTGIGPGQWQVTLSLPHSQRGSLSEIVTLVPGQTVHKDLRVTERNDAVD
jgi:beta-lactamase regulating signal transducer with metallopeptidase domain